MNRRNSRFFFIIGMLYWTQQLGYVSYLSPYMTLLGAGSSITGFMLGAYGMAQIGLRFTTGVLAGKKGQYRQFIIIGNAVGVVAMLGMWLFPIPWLMVVFRFLTGVTASVWTCYTVFYGGYFSEVGMLQPQSHTAAMNYGGQIIGYLIAAPIVKYLGYKQMFFAMFLLSLLCFVMSLLTKENGVSVSGTNYSGSALKEVLKDRYQWMLALAGCVLQFVTFSGPAGFTSQVAVQLGADPLVITALSLVFSVSACFSAMVLSQRISKWLGARKTVIILFFVFPLYCFLIPLCRSVGMLIALQAVMALTHGTVLSLTYGMTVKDLPYEKQGAAMGLQGLTSGVGTMLGPIAAGLIAEKVSLSGAFVAVGVIGLLAPLFMAMMPKEQQIK